MLFAKFLFWLFGGLKKEVKQKRRVLALAFTHISAESTTIKTAQPRRNLVGATAGIRNLVTNNATLLYHRLHTTMMRRWNSESTKKAAMQATTNNGIDNVGSHLPLLC